MHFPSPPTLTLTLPLLLLTATLLLPSISADDLELTPSDIPTPCWPVCGETVGITESCYHQYHHLSSSSQELSCICNWAEAPTLLPLCEACIANHRSEKGDSDVHDNEAYEILTSCSLSTTTWNPAAATSILSAENNTASATTTASSSGAGGNNRSSASATSTLTSTSTSTGSGSGAQATGNVAAGMEGPGFGLVSLLVSVGVGMGVVGLV